MRVPAKLLLILFLLALPLVWAQNSAPDPQSELPAAPSAVRVPPPGPAPAPSPAPVDAKDEDEDEDDADDADDLDVAAESDAEADPRPPIRTGPDPDPRRETRPAAGTAPANGDQGFTYKVGVDEVNVVFTVTDRRGRFVKDLTADDIRVLDDEKPPAAISYFTRETDLPLRVGLLIDASNSIRDRFTFQQEAAIEFFHQTIRRNYDQAFVLGFDSTSEVTQDFTDDIEALSNGIRILRPGGGTALYDALFFASRDKLMGTEDERSTRRAIVLLSDGEDNQSRVTREEAIEMALRAEVVVYAISTNASSAKTRGDRVLERMAEATGGRAFFPFRLREVANALEDIQIELRSQYAVAYRPADFQPDGRFRSIEILTDNRRLQVRSRKGYYAPTQ